MPPKRARYDVDEYVTATHNPDVETRPMVTGQHTQYEMVNASRSSRVKTILSIEHEATAPVAIEDDVPELMEVNVRLQYH